MRRWRAELGASYIAATSPTPEEVLRRELPPSGDDFNLQVVAGSGLAFWLSPLCDSACRAIQRLSPHIRTARRAAGEAGAVRLWGLPS